MPAPRTGLAARFPTALVTGASSGIGKAIALRLHAAGITVYGTSRHPAEQPSRPNLNWLRFDAASAAGITDFISRAHVLLSEVDLLVNNAGGGVFGDLPEVPGAELRSQWELLVGAPVALTRAVLPGMRERGRGAIVNVTSLAAIFPLPYLASYTAGKAGLSGLTQSLMLTEAGTGVVVVDFQAGDYRTGFNAHMARYGAENPRLERVWRKLEANLLAAPPPERAAADLVRALERGRSAVVRSGSFFQRHIAPVGLRVLPRRWLLEAIRMHYGLGQR